VRKIAWIVVAALLVVAGCGSEAAVEVDGAWARTSPRMADAGAIYMEITAREGDRLMAASVDPSIAGTVEIHETVVMEMDDGSGGEPAEGMGAMMMQQVDGIDLPAGAAVALEPGGLHIMLLDIPAPLETGDRFIATLMFESAGEVTVEVEVRENAP
jgi:copper(I)-binding protein